jgi:hypothetical protein
LLGVVLMLRVPFLNLHEAGNRFHLVQPFFTIKSALKGARVLMYNAPWNI